MHEFICINPGNMWRNPPTAFTVINQYNLVKSFTTPVIFGKSFPGLELTRVYAGN